MLEVRSKFPFCLFTFSPFRLIVLFFFCLWPAAAFGQAPTITSVTPNQTPVNQTPAKITIRGSGFVAGSMVFFNRTPIPAKIKATGAKIIIKQAPAGIFQSSGFLSVKVVSPNGQESNTVTILVGSGNAINILEPDSLVVNAQNSVTIKAQVVDKDGKPLPNTNITFQSENPDRATVNSQGVVTGVSSGAATIRLSAGDATRAVTFAVNLVTSVPSGIFGEGDIVVDTANGFTYASDLKNHVIKGRTIGQALTDLAGTSGVPGAADGSYPSSRFNGPLGLGLGTQRILLADTANRAIRRLNPATTQVETIIRLSDVTAAVPTVKSWGPRGIIQASDGAMYITDAENSVIWRARLNGNQVQMSVLAGSLGQPGLVDGTGTAARFNNLQEISSNGNILTVTDRGNKVVRLVALPSGQVSTLGRAPGSRVSHIRKGRQIPLTDVQFNDPIGIDLDRFGNLYVTDGDSVSVISRVNSNVVSFTDLAQAGTFQNAVGVSVSGNSTFVLDAGKGQVIQIGTGAPTINLISPNQVNFNQSVEITLTGTNFISETEVRAGSQVIPNVSIDNAGKLRFQLPPQPNGGNLLITVTHRGGSAQIPLTVIGPPAAPSDLVAQVISNSQVVLRWTDNSSNETGFIVERKVGTSNTFARVTTTGPNVTTFTDSGLTSGTSLTYRVRAVNTLGESANSNEALAVPRNTVRISFSPPATTAAPGGQVSFTVNFDVSTGTGDQPGTILLDIPLDPERFDLKNISVTPGTLIPTNFYSTGDLVTGQFDTWIRIVLTSGRDPLNAKLNAGQGSFCTVVVPVLNTAPSGTVSLDVSNTPPQKTQLNQSLKDGGQVIPFVSTAGSITIR